MGRIRTIKPEFPQSQSVGNLTRDARLLFLLLFTVADDSGTARGNSRMLASLLYPYDKGVDDLINDWLHELEAEGMVDLYVVDGTEYLRLTNWHKHQKVDKPSASKFPPFDESSRRLANPRGGIKDQGSRIKEGDQGGDASKLATPARAPAKAPEPPPPPAAPAPKPSKARPGFDAGAIELPAWLDRDTWLLWCADRKKRGKPITEAAAGLQLKNLDKLRAQGFKAEAVIEHSIANGYQGLFPPRGDALAGNGLQADPKAERAAQFRGRRPPPPDTFDAESRVVE